MATEVKPKSNRILLIFGFFLAIVAFGGALLVGRTGGGANSLVTGSRNIPAVVATKDIPASTQITTSCNTPLPPECNASQLTTGPDHRKYRVDTYVVNENPATTYTAPTGSPHATTRTLRRVTVVVRDGTNTSSVLAREMSTFDCSTALPYASGCPTT